MGLLLSLAFLSSLVRLAACALIVLSMPLANAQCSLDFDGDNAVTAAVDGVLLARASSGVGADALVEGLPIAPNAPRKTGQAISDYFTAQCGVNLSTRAVASTTGCTPDIDGDGFITSTIDGLILSRVRRIPDSTAIIGGIVFPLGATRNDWTSIRNHLVNNCGVQLSPPSGPNVVVAGDLSLPYPTIKHLSVLWSYTNDANQNSSVSIRFRKVGTTTWQLGMPLRRVFGDTNVNVGYTWASRHAGSIFDLEPSTTYEIEATLTDPDGGSETRTVTGTTRSVPTAMAGAPIKNATPSNLSTVLNGAQPGDIIQLADGTYDGFAIGRSGQAGQPIVIRGSTNTIVNGEVGIFLQNYVHIERLTVNGRIRFNGSNNVSITRNTVNATSSLAGEGIVTKIRSENAYIADNIVTGVTVWQEASLGNEGNNLGEGILIIGPGHVIEHNRVTGFRDCISFTETTSNADQISIDVLNNDVSIGADDGIEADFCQHNCRVIGNRITNSFVAISSQPSLGGPTYFIRNAIYNVTYAAFKLHRRSTGDVILHNSVVKNGDAFGVYTTDPFSRTYMRNNLMIGGPGATLNSYSSGVGRVIDLGATTTTAYDGNYDGYGSTLGTFEGRIGSVTFNSLATLRSNTSQKNAIQVGLNVFASSVAFPANGLTLFSPVDLRLASGVNAIDAGIAIPNVNDGFAGTAPDLGAYELGRPVPVYGPR
jgi:hypothetical protein